jgi:hypothetical protein
MKKLFLFSFLLFTSSFLLFAQAPQGIPYQAIARNASGVAIANTAVKVRFSIRDSIATGAIKYQETHNPTTSALGLFSVNVGMGTMISGTFSGINWGKNAKFLQVEMDPTGGAAYTDLGTTQMMSVPYALYAGTSESFSNSSSTEIASTSNFYDATINGVSSKYYLPSYLFYEGSGSESDLNVTSIYDGSIGNSVNYHEYQNLRILANGVYNINSYRTMYLLVKDTLKISNGGRIDGSGTNGLANSNGGSNSTLTNTCGAGGGGAVYFQNCSSQSSDFGWQSELSNPNLFPPEAGFTTYGGSCWPGPYSGNASYSNPASNGQSITTDRILNAIKVRAKLNGGAGSSSTNSSYPASRGGNGGGGLYIICKVLVFDGLIKLTGGNAGPQATGYSGYFGGGGGGGSVVISAGKIISNSGSFQLNGGNDTINTGYRKGGDGAFLIIDR